jgi:hypothetical protein
MSLMRAEAPKASTVGASTASVAIRAAAKRLLIGIRIDRLHVGSSMQSMREACQCLGEPAKNLIDRMKSTQVPVVREGDRQQLPGELTPP